MTSTTGDASVDEIGEHILLEHNGGTTYYVDSIKAGSTHHDAVTETVYVVDQAAYDEQVIDHYECSCGATK